MIDIIAMMEEINCALRLASLIKLISQSIDSFCYILYIWHVYLNNIGGDHIFL